jgi:hypothetical protein
MHVTDLQQRLSKLDHRKPLVKQTKAQSLR